MRKLRYLLWTLVFALSGGMIVHAFAPQEAPFATSPKVGGAMPAFALPSAITTRPGLDHKQFRDGKPRLLNIFASWCLPCQAEAPHLRRIAKAGFIVEGIAVRDSGAGVARFVNRHGNPFTHIGLDAKGEIQKKLGTSGIPESFVIAGDGTILHHHVGDIRDKDVADLLLRLRKAR